LSGAVDIGSAPRRILTTQALHPWSRSMRSRRGTRGEVAALGPVQRVSPTSAHSATEVIAPTPCRSCSASQLGWLGAVARMVEDFVTVHRYDQRACGRSTGRGAGQTVPSAMADLDCCASTGATTAGESVATRGVPPWRCSTRGPIRSERVRSSSSRVPA
jgi:hypothetical protein